MTKDERAVFRGWATYLEYCSVPKRRRDGRYRDRDKQEFALAYCADMLRRAVKGETAPQLNAFGRKKLREYRKARRQS